MRKEEENALLSLLAYCQDEQRLHEDIAGKKNRNHGYNLKIVLLLLLSLFNFYPKVSGCNAEPPNVTLARLTGLKVLEHVSGLWNAAASPDAY